jgi:HCOMODA/2-hydroxy-3-carboxy-muconic semialdehyde decarboxylase
MEERMAVAGAQQEPKSGGPVDPEAIEDLVAASLILADQGVLDGFGHVSIRHPNDPNRYLLSRNLAPALVTAADIMEYDLNSNPVDPRGRRSFLERFIHGEVYKARPDVHAVVHSHSPSVVPFGISSHGLKPVYHMSGFLAAGVPNWDIREAAGGPSNMLVTSVIGANVKIGVYRAVYTEINARLQLQAEGLGGALTYLTAQEGAMADETIMTQIERPWQLWRKRALEGR